MTDLFFYGTLRHIPLLERVMGRTASALSLETAVLRDHAVHAVQGQVFPMILHDKGAGAKGILARGLTSEDLARLAFYEGGFDYDLRPMTVVLTDGAEAPAQVFFPAPDAWVPGDLWSLQGWVEALGEVTALAAEEEMAYFGKVDARAMSRSMPAIQTRAWAKLFARQRKTSDPRDVANDVIVHRHTRAYVDYFGMEEIELQHRQHDGSMGAVLSRNALLQGSAVVVLPYDPVRDTVLLVEQFRPPVYLIDDPEPWMWEPVAGMIDPGETPENAAHRETLEEAHVKLKTLEYAGGAYSSSGSSTEYIYLYVGLGELTETTNVGGLDTEGEDIRTQILPFPEFMQMVDGHVFKDLPLLSLAHWLARHRDRLRA
ncbi:NUDIX domain-containing protein [Rhodobacteraceae bacterium B1Z28]|uniref:ADP-ribose pyrophosphatase n=1 Tax=Ruegeria haliotis TaxID=2747601 RepID=A0ABX2PMR0_9RHOB|nr:NUDIX domain-containing protein [Ruegeria haliotis]NVO55004.1 NUDIX domain-containing protein [Ruegeria haliotis]